MFHWNGAGTEAQSPAMGASDRRAHDPSFQEFGHRFLDIPSCLPELFGNFKAF